MMSVFAKNDTTPRAQYYAQDGASWFDVYFAQAKNAFVRAWRWKTLWLWGILLPATGGMHFNSMGWGDDSSGDYPTDMGVFLSQYLVWIILAIVFVLVMGVIFWMLGNIARWGLTQTLSEIQDTGAPKENRLLLVWHRGKRGVGKLMLFDIIVFVALILFFAGIGLLIAVIGGLLYAVVSSTVFIVLAVLGLFVLMPPLIVVGIVVRYVINVAVVLMALRGDAISVALKRAWHLVRDNKKEVIKLLLTRMLMGMVFGLAFVVGIMPILLLAFVVFVGLFGIGSGLDTLLSTGFFLTAVGFGIFFVVVIFILSLLFNAITSLMVQDLWVWWTKRLDPTLHMQQDTRNQ